MFICYVCIFYIILQDSVFYDILILHIPNNNNKIYPWYSYSLLHVSNLHLWMNMACFVVYSGIIEFHNSTLKTVVIHTLSVIGGTLCLGFQLKYIEYQELVVLGSSGGVYGLLGAILAHLIINYDDIITINKVLYISTVICTFIFDLVLGLTYRSSNIAYSIHVGGFVVGLMSGITLTKRYISCLWKHNIRFFSIFFILIYFSFGIYINILIQSLKA